MIAMDEAIGGADDFALARPVTSRGPSLEGSSKGLPTLGSWPVEADERAGQKSAGRWQEIFFPNTFEAVFGHVVTQVVTAGPEIGVDGAERDVRGVLCQDPLG